MLSVASDRSGWFALGLLIVLSPLLAFPRSLAPAHQSIAATAGVLALVASVALLRAPGRMTWWVGGLALLAVLGYWRAVDTPSTLDHFCGLALGLLAMATVTAWCTRPDRLVLATCLILLFGVVALGAGVRSSHAVYSAKAFPNNPLAVQSQPVPLPLPALYSRKGVSPNALGATAMMILPIAVAVAWAPTRRLRFSGLLRVAGFLTVVWATTVLVAAQSRSTWLAAACLLMLLTRKWLTSRVWWSSVGILGGAVAVAIPMMAPTHPLVIVARAVIHERMLIWVDALDAWRSSPWFGIGLDAFRQTPQALPTPYLAAQVGHAHNMFLQTALDVGIVGLLCYLVTQVYLLTRAYAIHARGGHCWPRYLVVGAALSLVSVHVFGLLDAVPLGTKVGLLQWLAAGLILAPASDPAGSEHCVAAPARSANRS